MTKMIALKSSALVALATSLAGCGGTDSEPAYANLGSTTNTALAVTALTQSGASVGTTTGTFNGGTDEATVDGKVHTLDSSLNYVATIDPSTAAGDTKIIAVATDTADMPTSGTATYSGEGHSVVTVANGPEAGTYEGDMDVAVSATFGAAPDVDIAMSNLSNGTFTTTGGAQSVYAANGSETVEFNDLALSGSSISADAGSSVVVDGFGNAAASLDTSAATNSFAGVFAGPNAAEVGGVGTSDGIAGFLLAILTGTKD